MKIAQKKWTAETGWVTIAPDFSEVPQLILVFGNRTLLANPKHYEEIRSMYPHDESHILTASTAGEIMGNTVADNSLAVTAVYFEKTALQFTSTTISDASESEEKGKHLANNMSENGLVHVLVFCDGLKVNGTPFVHGLINALPPTVSVTGGLVGDGPDFKSTLVGLDAPPQEGNIVAIGLYGDSLKVGYGSFGGWDAFGVIRTITKSHNNILYELDGKSALAVYKEYLGEKANELPSSGLFFPLNLTVDEDSKPVQVVRTVLGVNESDQSMTFAGDMPEGAKAQFMKANFERLIDGAHGAAIMSVESLMNSKPNLAILISCVGRKLVLQERTEEEIEAVHLVVGQETPITGFYSYGEICPTAASEKQCKLHNQTMTITTLREE